MHSAFYQRAPQGAICALQDVPSVTTHFQFTGPARGDSMMRSHSFAAPAATGAAAAFLAIFMIAFASPSRAADQPSAPAAPPAGNSPATAPAPQDQASPPAGSHVAPIEMLDADQAHTILGKRVSSAAGENMGLVVDVLFDDNKQPRAAVIDFGGFLGVGTRKIAVDWQLIHFEPSDAKAPIRLDLVRADIQAAPEFKPDADTASVVAPPAQDETPASGR
jgi:hypothetical protein